jgi:hypothetical protein
MKRLQLVRVCENEDTTFGILVDNYVPFLMTVENAWRDNKRNVSCIPTGEYICKRYNSRKYGITYVVKGVTDRTGILFHRGNTHKDTRGCILLGSRYGMVNGIEGIQYSDAGFRRFMRRIGDDTHFELEIRSCVTTIRDREGH